MNIQNIKILKYIFKINKNLNTFVIHSYIKLGSDKESTVFSNTIFDMISRKINTTGSNCFSVSGNELRNTISINFLKYSVSFCGLFNAK